MATGCGLHPSPPMASASSQRRRTALRASGTPATARLLRCSRGTAGPVFRAAFSPDGSAVVTASFDNTARVFALNRGAPAAVFSAHADAVTAAAFNGDGTRVVTASQDNTAQIWNAATGAAVAPPLRHDDAVTAASFSPDGSKVVTASDDKTARVWDATSGAPLATLVRAQRTRRRGGVQSRRHAHPHRGLRPYGATMGRQHRSRSRHVQRPHRLGERRKLQPGWRAGRDRGLRPHGAAMEG